jgi:hypothetical protein
MIFIGAVLREWFSSCRIAFGILVVVFAIEKFDFIARFAIDYELDLSGFVVLFLSNLPSIMDLIIPIATVIALYLSLLNIRERREFVILAAAGVGARPFLIIAVIIASLALLTSILISGFVKPAANYAFRQQYERSLSSIASNGPADGRFLETGDTVVHVSTSSPSEERKLSIFGFVGQKLDYVYLSDCARLRMEGKLLYSDTCAARIFHFKPASESAAEAIEPAPVSSECPTCNDERARLNIVRIEGGRTAKAFDLKSLFKTIDRNRVDELSIIELLAVKDATFVSPDNARRAVKDLLLATTNLLAIACGLVAVALTTARTRFVALPLAIAGLMGTLVAVGSGALIPAITTPFGAAAAVLTGIAAGVGALVAVSIALRDLLTAPRMGRA